MYRIVRGVLAVLLSCMSSAISWAQQSPSAKPLVDLSKDKVVAAVGMHNLQERGLTGRSCGHYFIAVSDSGTIVGLIISVSHDRGVSLFSPAPIELVYVTLDSSATTPSLTPWHEAGAPRFLITLTQSEYDLSASCLPPPKPNPFKSPTRSAS